MEKRTDYKEFSDAVKAAFGEGEDLVRMDFDVAGRSASVFFVDGVIDKELCELNIFSPLKALKGLEFPYIDKINAVTRPTSAIKLNYSPDEAAQTVADGDIVLIIDGGEGAFVFSERKYQIRGIQEPPVSNVLRGPREGFIEDFKANCVMIRRRLRTPKLRFINFKVGRLTNTVVSVAYIANVADKRIVDEICKKIKAIDIDGVVESSYVAAFLEDGSQSLFDRVGTSEKPDIVCAKMLEGRVAVIVDGSPVVLTLPFILLEHLQASEDYYVKSLRATLIRTIRIMALLIAVLLPAAYVALQEFQYQMFPLKFGCAGGADGVRDPQRGERAHAEIRRYGAVHSRSDSSRRNGGKSRTTVDSYHPYNICIDDRSVLRPRRGKYGQRAQTYFRCDSGCSRALRHNPRRTRPYCLSRKSAQLRHFLSRSLRSRAYGRLERRFV